MVRGHGDVWWRAHDGEGGCGEVAVGGMIVKGCVGGGT